MIIFSIFKLFSFRLRPKGQGSVVTARHPGFVGFQNHVQIGAVPMGNRWGGTKLDMRQDLKTIMLMQYTFWRDWKDHEEMHRQNWSNLFRLCLQCADQMVWGPYEPLYEIVYADMPLNTEMTDFTLTSPSPLRARVPVI